ncbi:MAG: 4'-phosphopantetheinyl transferase superfamily protein [Clostridium sp.]|nr:4'-phosphopantetheinyl transferase superfamily protein [Clostridium sp.]
MIYQYYNLGKGNLGKNHLMDKNRRSKLLLAYGLWKEAGIISPKIIRNSFGKPMIKDHSTLFISSTHSESSSALMISNRRVGIDLERIRPYREVAAKRVLNSEELENLSKKQDRDVGFFQLFTLKESYIKALGCGFAYPVKKLSFYVDPKGRIQSNRPHASFYQREDSMGFLLSICLLKK